MSDSLSELWVKYASIGASATGAGASPPAAPTTITKTRSLTWTFVP